MKANFFTICFLLFLLPFAKAQIINGQDTLYGNEWINFDQSYFKVMVAEDGIYRIPQQTLATANLPLNQINGDQFQLFHNGEEVPIYVTTDGQLGSSDFIEFFGKKNTSELDRHLFKDPDAEMMNPLYSLFTDTSAYFLTWKPTSGNLRYETIANDLTNLPPKEEYFMADHVLNYFSNFSKKSNAQGISSSDFGMTEGFSTAFANTQTITITPPNVYTGGPNAELHIRYGTNIGAHQQLITLNDQPLVTDEFTDFQVRQLNFDVDNGLLSSPMALKFLGLAASTDRQRIANVILKYPSAYNFSNQPLFRFELPVSNEVRYLEIANFNAAGGLPVLYDLTNQTRLVASFENGLVKIALPPSNAPVSLALANDATGIRTINSTTPTTFINYAGLNAAYILLSNTRLYDDGNGNNWVQEYANYRSSATGGGYETVIVDIQQLYDQFAWGLHRHPLSIRNFGHFVKKYWPAVQYFFVVGKGREYHNTRTAAQLANVGNATYFIPTFGVPGADNLLLSTNSSATPIIPFGRLPVSSASDIDLFLKKIKDHQANLQNPQTIYDRQWMKEIIHLGGGGVASEQSLIKGYLANMENIVESNEFGGNVSSFYKTSTDPIQVSISEQIFQRINEGTSIITFFGHSAVGTFDFNIDNPDNYNNYGKYPVVFSLGCYSGNIHTSGLGISERFIFQPDKVAIGMVATTGQGYISALYNVMSKFYELLGGEMYGASMGELLQKTINNFETFNATQPELLRQFTYNGDPAFRILTSPGPDYVIDAASVNIEPKVVNIRQDSFQLNFKVVNIGRHLMDTIVVRVEHEMPNGNRIIASEISMQAPSNVKPLSVKLSTIGKESVGLNRINIIVDALNSSAEYPQPMAEMNNSLESSSGQGSFRFFIIDNAATPIYPSDFAIVGESQVTLRASTSDPLAPVQNYVFQIDTSKLFDSPLMKSMTIQQGGGLITWQPDIAFENEKVYYWRISPDSLNPELGYAWDYRSFTYINGSEGGWSQRHYYQFLENQLEDLELDEEKRDFGFLSDYKDFRIRNKVFNASDPPNGYVNGARWSDFFRWDVQGTLTVVVFDTIGRIWFNWNPGEYGSVNTSAARIGAFPFPMDNVTKREAFVNFIDSIIPDNYWVFVYTAQRNFTNNLNIADWEQDSVQLSGKNIFNVLELQGASHIRSLKDNLVPYLVGFRKNHGLVGEEWADTPQGEFNFEIPIPGLWYEGQMQSKFAGPSAKWDKFIWKLDTTNQILEDTFYVNIYGVAPDLKSEQLFFEQVIEPEVDLAHINPDSFPFIRLEYYVKDSIERTPVQLKDWSILYQGLPDAAFNPSNGFTFYTDTLQEGENLRLSYYISPTMGLPMDSLLVAYQIKTQGTTLNNQRRESPLPPDDGFLATYEYPTKGLSGEYQLLVEINPAKDQQELYDFNNYLLKNFYVGKDRRNPLLDVTFDGLHIMDGDIVAPNPAITISLKDENPYLLLSDTSIYNLFLKLPDGTLQEIPLNSSGLDFLPAEAGSENKSMLSWRPEFTKDGEYTLIVQAADASGNNAGTFDYKISFKVVLDAMLSNVLAYPNPFSTSTRFVYTLTGEVPTFFKLQIMTVSGRIVREITQDDIGPLKIGTHQTELVWDGTDEFGDRLANGIYLYRVIAQNSQNEDFKLYETGTDGYFNKGFGKLAIIR